MKILPVSILGLSLLLTGCAGFDSEIKASADVNPDINGDPSPIAVTVFELSDPVSFKGAGFVNLYTNPQAVLGSTLLAQKSLVLAPGETRSVRLPVLKNANYIGYIAAYRNLDAITWQALVPVNPSGVFGQSFNVNVTTGGIQIQNQEP